MILGLSPVTLAVIVAGFAALTIFTVTVIAKKSSSDKETIDSEGLTEKLEKIFVTPTKSQGSKINDIVKIRGTGSTPRIIGLALYGKENNVQIVTDRKENGFETETSKGITYTILEGSPAPFIGYKMKKLLAAIGIKDLETYDVPRRLIVSGDDYIWFKPKAHFVRFNGIKRHFDFEGLSRAWEASFSKTHENFLETMGDIPEQYSVLNNRISGQLKVENMKSENFREFEKLKKDMDKKDAMNS